MRIKGQTGWYWSPSHRCWRYKSLAFNVSLPIGDDRPCSFASFQAVVWSCGQVRMHETCYWASCCHQEHLKNHRSIFGLEQLRNTEEDLMYHNLTESSLVEDLRNLDTSLKVEREWKLGVTAHELVLGMSPRILLAISTMDIAFLPDCLAQSFSTAQKWCWRLTHL